MEYLIGSVLACLAAAFGNLVGMDRDRAFYATVLVVVATYYLLFACMAGSTAALLAELLPALLFVGLAGWGFRASSWLVVGGLALHGVFDLFHATVITNPGVPAWWPGFCMSYDVAAAACLAVLLLRRRDAAAT